MNARQNARHRRYEGGAETRTFIALMALCIITLLAAVGLGFKMRDSDLGKSITRVLTGFASRQTPGIQGPGSQSPLVQAPDVTAPNVAAPDVTAPDVTAPNMAAPDVTAPSVAAPNVAAPNVAAPDIQIPNLPSVGAPGSASTVGTGDVVVLFSIGVVVLLTVSGLLCVRLRMRAE